MAPDPRLTRFLIEYRYKPRLSFYQRMDAAGESLSEEFPDWSRSAVVLKLFNKSKHRRLFFAHVRSLYASGHCDDATEEFEFAAHSILQASKKLNIQMYSRIGIRQWFVADVGVGHEKLVRRLHELFFAQNDKLMGIFGDQVTDLAYVVYFEQTEGWWLNAQVGPMKKEEFFQPQRGVLDPGEDGAMFDRYRELLPENFVFIDLDFYQKDVQRDRAVADIPSIQRRGEEKARALATYCSQEDC